MTNVALDSGNPVLVTYGAERFVLLPEIDYKEFLRLKNNAEFLEKLDRGREDLAMGRGVVKTIEELEAMTDAE